MFNNEHQFIYFSHCRLKKITRIPGLNTIIGKIEKIDNRKSGINNGTSLQKKFQVMRSFRVNAMKNQKSFEVFFSSLLAMKPDGP